MHDHAPRDDSRHRWTFRSTLHILGAIGDFRSSDLNRAAVDLIGPQPGMILLDLGAGLGPATTEAAPRVGPVGRVIAVDPSATMRRALRLRRLWQRSRQVIVVCEGAAEHLPVEAGSIDAALAVNVAHHFNDVELAAAELARVLKPGGRILLIDEDFTSPSHPFHAEGKTGKPEPVDAASIVRFLGAAGLAVTRQDHRPIAGVTATIISAVAPSSQAAPDANRGQPPEGAS